MEIINTITPSVKLLVENFALCYFEWALKVPTVFKSTNVISKV